MTILVEALTDTSKLVPLLAVLYFLVAFLEYRYGDRIGHTLMRIGAWGPVAGAFFGCLPQCGFSVVAAALYVKRLASVGTLLAVFISTSDEAVPVLLSMPDKAPIVVLLIATKVMIAVIAGITVDVFVNRRTTKAEQAIFANDKGFVMAIDEHKGCCSHVLSEKPSIVSALLWHPLLHTIKISMFLFVLTILLSLAIKVIGEERIGVVLLNGTAFQPLIASLIGLIPNCFASVLLAQLYAKGVLSLGSLIAGLCAASGLGILVLVKENKPLKDTLTIIGLLLGISISAGVLVQAIGIIR